MLVREMTHGIKTPLTRKDGERVAGLLHISCSEREVAWEDDAHVKRRLKGPTGKLEEFLTLEVKETS